MASISIPKSSTIRRPRNSSPPRSSNPEAAAARGLWDDRDFLEKAAELNPQLKHTQFADYHGHGWMYRAVFKHDREGNLLDLDDKKLPSDDFKHAVHLNDIHLQKGMQCVDCHFEVEVHGNGLLYGEPRNATTVMCIDCHGTVETRPTLMTSGAGGTWNEKTRTTDPVDLSKLITPWKPRFEKDESDPLHPKLFQNSAMSPDIRWEVPQTRDVVDPSSYHYNAKGALCHDHAARRQDLGQGGRAGFPAGVRPQSGPRR